MEHIARESELESSLGKGFYGRMDSGNSVPAAAARLGTYLHALQECFSHWGRGDVSPLADNGDGTFLL